MPKLPDRHSVRGMEGARPLPEYSDGDKMPFGKYGPDKGDHRTLSKVPANYLLWLWNDSLKNELNMNSDRGKLARYIRTSMKSLMQEDPDTIVDEA